MTSVPANNNGRLAPKMSIIAFNKVHFESTASIPGSWHRCHGTVIDMPRSGNGHRGLKMDLYVVIMSSVGTSCQSNSAIRSCAATGSGCSMMPA